MIFDHETARITASYLLQINAIKLNPENPFTWASGLKSPIYCDNRIILSHPVIRGFVARKMASQVKSIYGNVEVIAGVATGAIGIGMLVAEALGLPFIYVRPEPKSHGRKNQIEGALAPNQKVVVIEDLISTGKSSLNAVNALVAAKADVLGMIAIFTYGFQTAQANFEKGKVNLHTLSNYEVLLEEAMATAYIDADKLKTLKEWMVEPSVWK